MDGNRLQLLLLEKHMRVEGCRLSDQLIVDSLRGWSRTIKVLQALECHLLSQLSASFRLREVKWEDSFITFEHELEYLALTYSLAARVD